MGAEGGKMRVGRPKKTRQDTTNEDLKEMGLDWKDASSVAGDHTKWRTLITQCFSGNMRNKVSETVIKFIQHFRSS